MIIVLRREERIVVILMCWENRDVLRLQRRIAAVGAEVGAMGITPVIKRPFDALGVLFW